MLWTVFYMLYVEYYDCQIFDRCEDFYMNPLYKSIIWQELTLYGAFEKL